MSLYGGGGKQRCHVLWTCYVCSMHYVYAVPNRFCASQGLRSHHDEIFDTGYPGHLRVCISVKRCVRVRARARTRAARISWTQNSDNRMHFHVAECVNTAWHSRQQRALARAGEAKHAKQGQEFQKDRDHGLVHEGIQFNLVLCVAQIREIIVVKDPPE